MNSATLITLREACGLTRTDLANLIRSPTEYSILTCIQKYDVGSLEDFCSEFGYDNDSMTANKTYIAIQKEYNDLLRLGFNDSQMEQLQEIN